MTDQTDVLANVRRGMIPAHIYNDRKIFELEKNGFSRAPGFSSGTTRKLPSQAT